MTDVLGIVGSISSPSKTRTAVESVLEGDNQQDANVDLLHLGEYDINTADGRVLSDYDGDTATVLEAIVRSDAFVIGTPVYRGSYSGLLKSVFDMIPRGQWQADVAPLEGSAVALVATGATAPPLPGNRYGAPSPHGVFRFLRRWWFVSSRRTLPRD